MSAYMVDLEHIQYLVAMARDCRDLRWQDAKGDWVRFRDKGASVAEQCITIGQMLWDENWASINARYPDTIDNPSDAPGEAGDAASGFVYRHTRKTCECVPGEVLMACRCYAYQSCEHEGWEQSEAYRLIEAIKGEMIRKLSDRCETAEWGVPERFKSSGMINRSSL